MTLRRIPYVLLPLLCAALAVPGAANAQRTGGTAAPEPAPTGGFSAVDDGAIAVSVRADGLLHRVSVFRGTARSSAAGRRVAIERFDAIAGQWRPATSATVTDDGRFVARWRATVTGRHRMRAVLPADAARAAAASQELTLTVYKSALATWYGPGFYGRETACGQRMTRGLLGVAHRKLPCGTRVALLYRGRILTVPVVDRGPFRRGVRWDLTAATAQALGMTATSRIGALRQ